MLNGRGVGFSLHLFYVMSGKLMGWKKIGKGAHKRDETWNNLHRFEHWYVDNQVCFITARVRDQTHAFSSDQAKAIFWDRFDHCRSQYSFTAWVTSLLTNHYHVLGYLRVGTELPEFIQRLEGSVAKLVNDQLPERIEHFLTDAGQQNYFDGCIRDELQARRAFRYTLLQCRRHKICEDWKAYGHTRMNVTLDRALPRAEKIGAYLSDVPYKRYQSRHRKKPYSRWDE